MRVCETEMTPHSFSRPMYTGKKVVEYGHSSKQGGPSFGGGGGGSLGYGTPGYGSSFSSTPVYGDAPGRRGPTGKTILYGHGKAPQTFERSGSSFGGGPSYSGGQHGRRVLHGNTPSYGGG